MKNRLLFLFVVVLLSAPGFGKTIELEVFRDWRGNNSEYKSSRPFFIIYDIHDLEEFWSKANADESMPWLDFEKYMLLVWHPGPSMFDHQPVKVEKFLYKDGKFIVLMDLEKKKTGGYWRSPFVATLLPRIKRGDISVLRREEISYGKIRWQHVYTIWDMQPGRNMPFEVAKMDEPRKKPQFIDPANHPKESQLQTSQSIVSRPVASRPVPAQATSRPQPQTQPTAISAAPARPATSVAAVNRPVPAKTATAATSARTETKKEKDADDDFFPDFGTPAPAGEKAKTPASPPAKPVKAPAADDDPLFGEEFDINF